MKGRAWIAGACLGIAVGALVASAMSFVDWRINPGGVFQGARGTNWLFVSETWLSWFVPVALAAAALLAPLLAFLSRRRRRG
jgi:hypothetical protein